MKIAKARKINIKIYIIPFIIVTLITSVVLIGMSNSIKNYFYEIKKEEGLKIARSISTNLSHAAESADTIGDLLEDKLKTSLKVIQTYSGDYSEEVIFNYCDGFFVFCYLWIWFCR